MLQFEAHHKQGHELSWLSCVVTCCCAAEARPARSAAEVQQELKAREEARRRVKKIWGALAAMVSGTMLYGYGAQHLWQVPSSSKCLRWTD